MELHEMPVAELAKSLREKRLSSEEITRSFLNRIEKTEPVVQAFNYINEKALEQAKETDEKLARGEELPQLAGIPIALKDNICTKGIATTCSSKILENFIPPYNATVYEKIKQSGMVLLGKTNMDEFAMGSSTENSAFKITNNPCDPGRVPGGSSGGSIAAVSAYQAPLSLGSDTGGSIRLPASYCGVVGLKTTYGLVSRYGLVAYASSLDQIGPVSGNVEDNALLLNLIAGYDAKDSTSVKYDPVDYTASLKKGVKDLKIGLPVEMFEQGLNEEVRASVMATVKKLEEHGAKVEEVSLPLSKYALAAYYIIATAEASSNLARYDGVKYGKSARKDVHDLESMYLKTRSENFGEEVKRRIMLGTYVLSAGYYDAYYKKALQYRTLLIREMEKLFGSYDVLVSPTSPTVAFKKGEKSDPMSMYLMDIMTVMVNLAGIPSISVPCGLDSNSMPIGIQLMAKPLAENILYQTAYTIEQNADFKRILKV